MIKYKWNTLLSDSAYLINYDPKCFHRNLTPEKPLKPNIWGEKKDRMEIIFFQVFITQWGKHSDFSFKKKEN